MNGLLVYLAVQPGGRACACAPHIQDHCRGCGFAISAEILALWQGDTLTRTQQNRNNQLAAKASSAPWAAIVRLSLVFAGNTKSAGTMTVRSTFMALSKSLNVVHAELGVQKLSLLCVCVHGSLSEQGEQGWGGHFWTISWWRKLPPLSANSKIQLQQPGLKQYCKGELLHIFLTEYVEIGCESVNNTTKCPFKVVFCLHKWFWGLVTLQWVVLSLKPVTWSLARWLLCDLLI